MLLLQLKVHEKPTVVGGAQFTPMRTTVAYSRTKKICMQVDK